MNLSSQIKPDPINRSAFELQIKERRTVNIDGLHSSSGESESFSEIRYMWDVESANTPFRISVNFKSINQRYKDHLNEKMSEDLNVSDGTAQIAISALKDIPFSLNLSKVGKVESIEGYELYKEKFITLRNSTNLNETLKLIYPREFITDIFRSIFSILPDKPLKIGDTWVKKQLISSIETNRATVTYRLVNIRDNIALIKANYKVAYSMDAGNLIVPMTGEGDGDVELDATTGDLISNKFSITVLGVGAVSNFEMNYNILHEVNMQRKGVKQ